MMMDGNVDNHLAICMLKSLTLIINACLTSWFYLDLLQIFGTFMQFITKKNDSIKCLTSNWLMQLLLVYELFECSGRAKIVDSAQNFVLKISCILNSIWMILSPIKLQVITCCFIMLSLIADAPLYWT